MRQHVRKNTLRSGNVRVAAATQQKHHTVSQVGDIHHADVTAITNGEHQFTALAVRGA